MTGAAGQDSPLEAFADQMRLLRRECAWKREQTHASLVPFVREEAEEVVEAIESGDPAALSDEARAAVEAFRSATAGPDPRSRLFGGS